MRNMKAIVLTGVFAVCGGSWAVSQTPAAGGTQDTRPLSQPSAGWQRFSNRQSIEILSDTQGVDLTFYARSVAAPIRRSWYQLMPEEAKPPSSKQGKAAVEFSVSRDGTASDVKLAQPSGDDAMDKAALDAVRQSSPFPELPHEYKGQSISLRVHFYYNPAPDEKFQGLGPAHGLVPGYIHEPNPAGSQQTMPRAIYTTEPEYSEQARRDKVEGVVILRITISATGDVTDAVVTKKLGSGLDEKALEAVRQWKFSPATKDGNPVSMEIMVETSFHLYNGGKPHK